MTKGSPGLDAGQDKDGNVNGLNEHTGEFRIGDITLATRLGGTLVLKERGREVEIGEGELQGLLHQHFFVDDRNTKA